jgi:hypothetical protein
MLQSEFYLCSELVRISTGGKVNVGNLEAIAPNGCTVTLESELPAGTVVRIRCMVCPLGKKSCTECRFKGRVRCQENDPALGQLTQVDFEGRTWSAAEWHPRHLTNLSALRLEGSRQPVGFVSPEQNPPEQREQDGSA